MSCPIKTHLHIKIQFLQDYYWKHFERMDAFVLQQTEFFFKWKHNDI